MDLSGIVSHLRSLEDRRTIEAMRRFGIKPRSKPLGISIPVLRALARAHRNDHALALGLWASGLHEARILAAYVDDPARVTGRQMDSWARDFDSWDVCDQVCGNLFDRTAHAVAKAVSWSGRRSEFVKRAGFALMASLAWHRKDLPDRVFVDFLALVRREAPTRSTISSRRPPTGPCASSAYATPRCAGPRWPRPVGSGGSIRGPPAGSAPTPCETPELNGSSKSVRHVRSGRFALMHGLL